MASQDFRQSPDRADETLRAGVVGLGTIGGGIVVSLGRRGRVAAVCDVRQNAASGLPHGTISLRSAAEVSRVSDVVFVAVVDAGQVADAIGGQDGVLTGAHPGLVVVVTSTVAVQVIREMAELCARHGATLLDCGVTGGSKATENGLLALVGGPDYVVGRVRPLLDDFAEEVVHCGPLGTGMATKIARNVVTYGCWRAVHEAVELAVASGVEPATLVEVIEASDRDHIALLSLQRLRMADRTVDAASRTVRTYLRNMDKDLDGAQQLGAETGVAVPLVDVTRAQGLDTFAWLETVESSDGNT
jgi:3-hydroxyisobutyrate dehydrogenase-like beta-hydroxyacid dehydrogenase